MGSAQPVKERSGPGTYGGQGPPRVHSTSDAVAGEATRHSASTSTQYNQGDDLSAVMGVGVEIADDSHLRYCARLT